MIEQSGDMTAAFSSALDSASTPAAEASPVSTPTTESTPSEHTPAAAIAQPEGEAQAAVTASTETKDSSKGEPPAWRWQDILENTRKTVAQETEARIRQEAEQQYGWAKDFADLSAEERAGLRVWQAALRGDRQAIAQIQGNSQAVSQLRGLIADQAPAADTEPEADLQAPDGTLVYSAPQQKKRDEWLMRNLTQQLRQEFQPLVEDAESKRTRIADEQKQAEQMRWAADVFAPIKRMPYFEELKPEIGKRMQALPADIYRDRVKAQEAVWDIYADLHKAKLDTHNKESESKVLANLQQRAVAATANPNAASSTTPKKFASSQQGFAEALSHFGQ